MRNKIRVYALALSVFVALAAPAFATSQADSGDNFFERWVNIMVVAFDESKIVVPVG